MKNIKKHTRQAMGVNLLLALTCVAVFPRAASAFSCTSNGVAIGGSGTFTIPIDVTIDKISTNILLTDLSKYTTCEGHPDTFYKDALRSNNASISSSIINAGFAGYVDLDGTEYPVPPGTVCVWPDNNCSTTTGHVTNPLKIKIGIKKIRNTTTSLTLPAGTEIATFGVQQRSANTWGWSKTWRFTLKSELVIPTYACQVNNPNQTVTLTSVSNVDLRNNGAGTYPTAKPFNINLDCDPQTTVSIQFDGTAMPGNPNILANTTAGNDSVGIQINHNGTPINLGTPLQIVANAGTHESLAFDGHYFYNGGAISPGAVTSVATFTMTYN